MTRDLPQKLRIKEKDVLLTINAPSGLSKILGTLPAGAKLTTKAEHYHQVHWFVRNRKEVEAQLPGVLSKIRDDVICWIYFPKGTSGVQTDLTRDKGWDTLLQHKELKWLSLISLNGTWSGFAMRRSTSPDKKDRTEKASTREILNWVDPATKTVTLPPPLKELLLKNKKALENFHALSFTNKKEFVEWIVTAKRDTTREVRLHETIQKLLKGWKNPRNL